MGVDFSSFSNKSSGFNRYLEQEPEELNFRIANGVILIIFILTTLLGNSAILITIWKTSSLHSAANILLVNLAVSDLAVGLFLEPFFMIANFLITVKHTVHIFLLYNIAAAFFSVASFITVTAIGIERLVALHLHLRYRAVVTPFRVTGVVILIWVLSGSIACSCLWDSNVLYAVISTTFVILLVGNLIVYLKIYLVVRRHQREIQQQQQQHQQQGNDSFRVKSFRKTALDTFLVYILLLFCYSPYVFVINMALAGLNFSPSVYFTVTTLVFLNSSLNPALYCWRDRELRKAVKKLLFRR